MNVFFVGAMLQRENAVDCEPYRFRDLSHILVFAKNITAEAGYSWVKALLHDQFSAFIAK